MRKLFTAALAALTLLGAGGVAMTAAADPVPYDRYDRRDDRRDDRYDRRDDRRDDRYDRRWDRRSDAWRRHVRRCERAYRSYNVRMDSYRTRGGQWRRCRL